MPAHWNNLEISTGLSGNGGETQHLTPSKSPLYSSETLANIEYQERLEQVRIRLGHRVRTKPRHRLG